MIRLPGLIDPHVHLRDPGQTEKETFYTGTCAALAGGYTTIIDMPNNLIPITTLQRLREKKKIAAPQIVCDVGFYFGSMGANIDEFSQVQDQVMGLKVFLNKTTGNYMVNLSHFRTICQGWQSEKPILIHAQEDILASALEIACAEKKNIHVCHVSSEIELTQVLEFKHKGMTLTCGVTPHHLFLTKEDEITLGAFGKVKPPLKEQKDQDFLWKHLDDIDCIESDHAPHTKEEKNSQYPPYGMPGLETTLPLLLTAAHNGKLTILDIKRLCHDNPARIFAVKQDKQTYIMLDETVKWVITNGTLNTKCNWSPFNGRRVIGKIQEVFLRGVKVFENDTIIAQQGTGKLID